MEGLNEIEANEDGEIRWVRSTELFRLHTVPRGDRSLLIIKYRPWIEKPKKSISPYKLIAILFVSNPIYHKCAKITEGD